MTKKVLLIVLLALAQVTQARIFIVDQSHASASDSNPGSEAQPWKTMQKAARSVQPGDTVYVRKGIYKGEVVIKNSGDPDRYILFSAYPGDEEQVVIDGSRIRLDGASFVRVSGFYVRHTNNHGIAVRGACDGVIISGNHTYDTFGSGISVWGVDWGQDPNAYGYEIIRDILIENNKIEKACNGGWNECITLSNGVVDFKILNNEIFNGGDPTNGGEGIDVKEGCRDGLISGNVIHGLTRRAIYLDGGGHHDWDTPPLENIRVTKNLAYANPGGHGLAIMTEGKADVQNIYIANNIFYNNADDGIMFYDHPNGSGSISDITVVNNTCYGHERYGILLNFPTAEHIVIRNNICYKNKNGGINLMNGDYISEKNITSNPHFVNADNADFHLQPDSPAIDAGTAEDAPSDDFEGNPRPYGDGYDIGALEYGYITRVRGNDQKGEQPESINLYPNYPNPFNTRTTIEYELEQEALVHLTVFDLTGHEVAFIFQGREGGGLHRKQWDAQHLPSGIYFLEMSVRADQANHRAVRKMILQK